MQKIKRRTFLSRIWGKAGHKDVVAHEETIYLGEDEGTFTASYPERTYEDVEPTESRVSY